MKKIILSILCLGLCLSLCACSSSGKNSSPTMVSDESAQEGNTQSMDSVEGTSDSGEEVIDFKKIGNTTFMNSDDSYALPMSYADFYAAFDTWQEYELKVYEFNKRHEENTPFEIGEERNFNLYYYDSNPNSMLYIYLRNDTGKIAPMEETTVTGFEIFRSGSDFNISVPGGIDLNESTIDDVVATYGEPAQIIERTKKTALNEIIELKEYDYREKNENGRFTGMVIQTSSRFGDKVNGIAVYYDHPDIYVNDEEKE